MRKNTIISCLLLALVILLTGCNNNDGVGSAKEKKVIKLAHSHQADFSSEIHTAAWIFQKWVNEHSPTLEVKIYASNALGQEREIYEAMQLGGGATCIISGTAILNNFNQHISALDLPFLWRDYEHVHKVLDGEVGRELASELKDNGFHVLAWMDSWGYRNVVTTNKPVKNLNDLVGLKIRTIETPIYLETLRAMGANATSMSFGEVYTSLQTGVLDGFEHGASIVKANKFYEVADHLALTKHLFGPLVFIYSQAQWDKLSEEEQKVVQEAALMARDIQRALAPVRDRESMEYLEQKGMSISEIDTEPIRENALKVQDKLSGEFDAVELLKKIREVK